MMDAHKFVLDDGPCSWAVVKRLAKTAQIQFRVPESDILFYLGPDVFPESYRMAWVTLEEQEDLENKFQDHRVRSSDPDDFLSRIQHLVSGTHESFVPKF